MKKHIITSQVKDLLNSQRLLDTLLWYLISLMLPADKHTQANAEKISGKDNSLFSNLLNADQDIAKLALSRASRRAIKKISKKRTLIERGSPWEVAIIIDATLHRRASRHTQDSQRFNHGKGWVVGHQWSNIGLLINGQFIPLPPIPFYTKKYCKKNSIKYKTEHKKICSYLRTLSLKDLGLSIDPDKVVLLLDSGYDNKPLQNTIISRGWDFVVSLKCDRNISPKPGIWNRIDEYFKDGRRPWKSVRIITYRGKKKKMRQYRYKEQLGFLKGLRRQVKLVYSKKSGEAKSKFLASSNVHVSSKSIILIYRKRWAIEIFHRDIKSYLGMEDAGVKSFKSLYNHVYWVYLAYILLKERYPEMGIKWAQTKFDRENRQRELKESLKILSRINGVEGLKVKIRSVIEKEELLIAA